MRPLVQVGERGGQVAARGDDVRLSVAHVHTALIGSGGDSVSELQARYLAGQGHRVIIIGATTPEIAARLAERRIEVMSDAAEARTAEGVAARTGALDIVHCHCFLSAPYAADLARATGAALVIHGHSMGEGWWEGTDLLSSMRSERQKLRRRINRAAKQADRLLFVSEAVYKHMRSIRLPIGRSVILPNPIDDLFFRPQVARGELYDVAVLARPSRAKNPLRALRILAEASALRSDLRMIWIGPLGRWERIMRNFVGWLGLRNIHFAGQLPTDQVCDILDSTRVLVSASNREGQPLSVLEALARGCSAFLSDIPAHRTFARYPGVELYSPANVAQAGRLLVSLLERHHRQQAPDLQDHRVEAHGQRLLAIYQEIVSARQAQREPNH